MATISRTQLLFDLYAAYEDACRHKSKKKAVKEFRKDFFNSLVELRDEIFEQRYEPRPFNCFIVDYPKKREVFAPNFRDRIVHHLYYNYVYRLFERTFIYDCYANVEKRGIHFGIGRCCKHIVQESNGYQEDCYALQMDIKGYFMHINRKLMVQIVIESLKKMHSHKIGKNSEETWGDVLDIALIEYLTIAICMADPTNNCCLKSKKEAWNDLPSSKSLFNSEEGCGLPLGSLTSQLFSNIYLNRLDQFVKRQLKCKHYGRYVDDFYIISKDKEYLKSLIPKIAGFLMKELQLEVSSEKTTIKNVKYGIEFLGAFIKPNRIYISNKTLKRITQNLQVIGYSKNIQASINSYLGTLSHFDSFNVRKALFEGNKLLDRIGRFDVNYRKFVPFND